MLRSLKRSGFIAGADINQFKGSAGAEIAASLRSAHAVVDRLDNLNPDRRGDPRLLSRRRA